MKIRIQIKTEIRSSNVLGLIRPKTIFYLKFNPCLLVFSVWWGHTLCFGASFHYFAVSVFCCLVMSQKAKLLVIGCVRFWVVSMGNLNLSKYITLCHSVHATHYLMPLHVLYTGTYVLAMMQCCGAGLSNLDLFAYWKCVQMVRDSSVKWVGLTYKLWSCLVLL